MTIHGNPLTTIPNFRIYVIGTLLLNFRDIKSFEETRFSWN
jgi:hypothetical protein